MSRIFRLGRYAAWSSATQFVQIGLPRLVLFPILASVLGDTLFGSAVLALSMVQMIGVSPCRGLAGYVIRDAAHHDESGRRQLVRTVLIMALGFMLPASIGFFLASGPLAHAWNDTTLATLLPCLGTYLLALNLLDVATAIYEFRRTFGRVFAIWAVQGSLQFLAIPLCLTVGVAGFGYAYALGGLAALACVGLLEHRNLATRPLWSAKYARGALRVWLPVSLSSLTALSVGYLDRVLIGWWWPPDVSREIAVFFAAASTVRLLLVPGAQASRLVFSLLGKARSSAQYSRRFYVLYLAGVLGASGAVLLVGAPLGEFVLTLLYPSLAEPALAIWMWVVAAMAAMNIRIGCRPFVNKFLPPKYLPIMTAIGAVAQIVPLVLLVPTGGAYGAAQAMLVGTGFTAAIWTVVYLRYFVFSDRDYSSQVTDVEENEGQSISQWQER
jgi:O-antigen/teichoic acid export membrane protein